MKAAVISLNGTSSRWTVEAMKKYFEEVDALDIRYLEITFSGEQAEILYKGKKISNYDCIFAKGSFRYANLMQSLTILVGDKTYFPISDRAFIISHDKLLTQLELQRNNVPMPTTYMASTIDAARNILERLNYPIILKFPRGTQGKGVLFAESYASASSILDALSSLRQPFIIQEYIETGGSDIRAFVIGDEVVAAFKRTANIKEKRSNLHAGGSGESVKLSDEVKRVAVKAAKAVGAEICGVDILLSHRGPVVLEINIAASLKGLTEHSGIDVADLIAKYLFEKTKKKFLADRDVSADKILNEIEQIDKEQSLITSLDFRGSRVLLPEVITKVADLKDEQDYEFIAKKGDVRIKKFNL